MIKLIDKQGSLKQIISKEPASKKCSNFTTHYLAFKKRNLLVRKQSLFYKCFLGLFLSVGVWLLIFITFYDPVYRRGAPPFGGEDIWGDLLAYFLSVTFSMAGFAGLFCEPKLIIDHALKLIYCVSRDGTQRELCDFDEIHSLQILKKRCSDGEDDYYAYELNIVTLNLKRFNILVHGGEQAIRRDAKLLSKFLKIDIVDHA